MNDIFQTFIPKTSNVDVILPEYFHEGIMQGVIWKMALKSLLPMEGETPNSGAEGQ